MTNLYIDLDSAISKIETEGILDDRYSNEERKENVIDMLTSIALPLVPTGGMDLQ